MAIASIVRSGTPGGGGHVALEETLVAALRRTAWGAALSDAEFRRVEEGISERRYPAGALVAAKGEMPEHWIGVLAGMLKVDTSTADGKGTSFMGVTAGGWLGESALLKKEPRRYDIVALQDARVLLVNAGTFDWLHEHSLAFNRFLVAQLNARLGQFVSLVERTRMHATSELIAFGLASLLEYGERRICISQEELGRLCGLSRQLTARCLHKLEEDGVVAVEYGSIRVRDPGGLQRAAGL